MPKTWARIRGDSVAIEKFIATDGRKVQARLEELLKKEQTVYDEGDTLFYLGGALNTLSHYYTSDYSEDVAGQLGIYHDEYVMTPAGWRFRSRRHEVNPIAGANGR